MALDLPTVIKQLTDSGIIAPGKLENFVPPKAHPKDAEELARQLVKADHLTPFQAQQVKGGRAKSLILGEYTILDKIGAGGMGQVFKAQHRRMKRLVAIKMLPPAVTKDAAAVARFQREVEAAAKLRHPNIVAADDAGYANGVHFLVMEYVDGKDLSALVKQNGPFPVPKAVNYILQAARGLEFAHSEGVVHRDIKPANLLLDKKEVVKILDMGLARIDAPGGDAAAQAELTGTGTVMGTVDYMAPEQALNTKHADARADIYSLGISLYYLIAGRAAYGGDSLMEKLVAHREQPIHSLQEAQTTVPKQLEAVFKKMVAKKIEDRYQTMSEVVAALERLGYGGSVTGGMGDLATTMDLSSDDRKKLASKATKKPLGSITEVVASEKTKYLFAKIIGGSFGTIVAPILVFYLIRHLEKEDKPAAPPAAIAPAASVPPVVVASNSTPLPAVHVENDDAPKPLVAPFNAEIAHAGQLAWAKHLGTTVESRNPVGMTLVLIPPGEFLMGSTPVQNAVGRKMADDLKLKPDDAIRARIKDETPQHRVTLTKPYLFGMAEVTVGQFRRFVEASNYVTEAEQYGFGNSGDKTLNSKANEADKGKNWKSPGYISNDDSPVTQVTWNDAVRFCNWLSDHEELKSCYRQDAKAGWVLLVSGTGYRLPTEAEWEYSCRAGTTTQFSFGDDPAMLDHFGWFSKNHGGAARAVGLKAANGFGLFDMHGNAQEWCHDFYDAKWYERSPSSDPVGPNTVANHMLRGGSWGTNQVNCRSAYRTNYPPNYRSSSYGFRVLRVSVESVPPVAVAGNTASQPTIPLASGVGQPNQPWNTPAFQAWVKATQALPAEKQIEAVSKKLMELNPGFDGVVTGAGGSLAPKIDNGVVTTFGIYTDNVSDISPIRALAGLDYLTCSGSKSKKAKLSDLSPLQGMPLTKLECSYTQVSELSPLREMKLTLFVGTRTPITDLSPLKYLKLTRLDIYGTKVSDLSPLEGMPLTSLICGETKVSDLSPLRQLPLMDLSCDSTQTINLFPLDNCTNLKRLNVRNTKVTPASIAALQKALPNCKIDWDDPAKPKTTAASGTK